MTQIKIFIIALGALLLSACSDSFLDSEPITSLTVDNFYNTKKDAELAIVGCYDGIQILYQSGVAFPILSEVLSDNCFGGTGKSDGYGYQLLDEFDLSRSPVDVDLLQDNWKNYYNAIYRCNILLGRMDNIEWEGDTIYRDNIEAQARFIRAYCYFDMARIWGHVPLLTVPTLENVPQANVDSVYKQIALDLLFTADKGSEKVEPGRINKWVAKAFIARAFLFYTGYYNKADMVGLVTKADALQGLEDIITSTDATYELISEFKNLWPAASSSVNATEDGLVTTYAGKDNAETVFAIKHNITSNYDGDTDSNHWLVLLGFRSQAFSPYGKGWGACTVNPKLYNAYEADDTRKEASIIGIVEEKLKFDNSDQREYTGYTNKKYLPLANPDDKDVAEANGGTSFQISQYQDYVVMRYSDVLLMAAELGSANAQDYFDQVRTRAGFSGSKTPTLENILEERRLEFAFEGIRYWDLLRQGVDKAAAVIAESVSVYSGGLAETKVILGSNIIKTKGLQIVPQTQIEMSGGLLKQNDGWK